MQLTSLDIYSTSHHQATLPRVPSDGNRRGADRRGAIDPIAIGACTIGEILRIPHLGLRRAGRLSGSVDRRRQVRSGVRGRGRWWATRPGRGIRGWSRGGSFTVWLEGWCGDAAH